MSHFFQDYKMQENLTPQQRYYQKNKELIKEQSYQWRKENPEKWAEIQKRYWLKKANQTFAL